MKWGRGATGKGDGGILGQLSAQADRQIRILAWIHIVLGGGLIAFALVLLAQMSVDPEYRKTLGFLWGMFFWIAPFVLLPSLIGGIGLLRRKQWGRLLIMAVSVEFLLAVPIGTVLGVYGLYTLLRQDAAPVFRAVPMQPIYIPPNQLKLLLILVAVGSGFAVVIGGGFLLDPHYRSAAPLPVPVVGAAVVAFAGSVALLLRGWRLGNRPRRVLNTTTPAPTVFPGVTGSCPHLERIEVAIRASGIPVKALSANTLQANCRVYRSGLMKQFGALEPVVYQEYFIAERAPEDIPVAEFRCKQCSWRIETRHPSVCDLSVRWFPASPERLIALAEHRIEPGLQVTSIACSPAGRYAAVAAGIYNTPQSFSIWDLARRKRMAEFPPHGVVRRIAWSQDEQTLVTGRGVLWPGGQGSKGPSLFVWNTANGTERLRFGNDLFGVRGVAISPDGRWLLASGMLGTTGLDGSTVDLWDLTSGRLLTRFAHVEHRGEPFVPVFGGVAFTPDGALAIAACSYYHAPKAARAGNVELPARWNNGVRAWRMSDGQEVDFAPVAMPVYEVAVSGDGTKLFFSGQRFGIWSLSQGGMLWDKYNYFTNGMAATRDCGLVARGTGYQEDNHGPYAETAVEIYDGNTGELVTLGLHSRPPEAIAFTPDGRSLIAGGIDGELKFWTMP